jgi:hypothetical protein
MVDRATVIGANTHGRTVDRMNTLADFTAHELDMDRTSAFLAKGLLRTPISAYADNPLALSQMLASRGLSKAVAALITKAATAPLDTTTGPGTDESCNLCPKEY